MSTSSAAALVTTLRSTSPLTMCVQNYVAMDISANVLLAAGASPAMVNAQEEADDFTKIASCVSINVGTALTPEWIKMMMLTADACQKYGKPWCLDPVGMGATPHRNKTCVELMQKRPTVVRGNASEIMALAGACKVELPEGLNTGGGKGVDSTAGTEEALPAAVALAKAYGSVVAISGAVDIITDGSKKVCIRNGHVLLTKVTGAGCSLSTMCAAYAAVSPSNVLLAVSAAFLHFTVASDLAVAKSGPDNPGSLRMHLVDHLCSIAPADVEKNAKVEELPV